jgi:GH25 family lysozyme M1 (1,4-beta-N-acetylmuramidase)
VNYCIDVSHHQDPAAVPWEEMRGRVSHVYVRGTYGMRPDERFGEHVSRARGIGAQVGGYHFYRRTQSAGAQIEAFLAVCRNAGVGPGDLAPALDLEAEPGQHVDPSWDTGARAASDILTRLCGESLVYVTRADWHLLGAPAWVLHRPLWVAHYTPRPAPASPGGQRPVMWQHRVGPFFPEGAGGVFDGPPMVLDQSRVLEPVPRWAPQITDEDRERVNGLIAKSLDDAIRDTDPAPERDA